MGEINLMSILKNLDNEYPLFESESSSLDIKVFSDTCCNGCTCKSDKDHKKEAVLQIDKSSNTLQK
jgi:hypothetical protein